MGEVTTDAMYVQSTVISRHAQRARLKEHNDGKLKARRNHEKVGNMGCDMWKNSIRLSLLIPCYRTRERTRTTSQAILHLLHVRIVIQVDPGRKPF